MAYVDIVSEHRYKNIGNENDNTTACARHADVPATVYQKSAGYYADLWSGLNTEEHAG